MQAEWFKDKNMAVNDRIWMPSKVLSQPQAAPLRSASKD